MHDWAGTNRKETKKFGSSDMDKQTKYDVQDYVCPRHKLRRGKEFLAAFVKHTEDPQQTVTFC
jgi:hypothetical protein